MSVQQGDDKDLLRDLEFLVDQERAQFDLYDARRLGVETQATAVTAVGLTVGALILAGVGHSHRTSSHMAGWAVISLVVSVAFALCARFVSWRWPRWLCGPRERKHLTVKYELEVLRAMSEADDSLSLRRQGRKLWKARAESAWKLGDHKKRLLIAAVVFLAPALVFVVTRGIELAAHGS